MLWCALLLFLDDRDRRAVVRMAFNVDTLTAVGYAKWLDFFFASLDHGLYLRVFVIVAVSCFVACFHFHP